MEPDKATLQELDSSITQLMNQAYDIKDRAIALRDATLSGSVSRKWCKVVAKQLDKICNILSTIETLES